MTILESLKDDSSYSVGNTSDRGTGTPGVWGHSCNSSVVHTSRTSGREGREREVVAWLRTTGTLPKTVAVKCPRDAAGSSDPGPQLSASGHSLLSCWPTVPFPLFLHPRKHQIPFSCWISVFYSLLKMDFLISVYLYVCHIRVSDTGEGQRP